jgi:dipeptidyl aminopeptidase/acylaminoacyl peptidase
LLERSRVVLPLLVALGVASACGARSTLEEHHAPGSVGPVPGGPDPDAPSSDRILVYVAQDPDTELLALDGGGDTPFPLASAGLFAWSPSGDHIAYIAAKGMQPQMWLRERSDGSWGTPIAVPLDGDVVFFEWAPDGSRLAVALDQNGAVAIAVVTLGDGGVEVEGAGPGPLPQSNLGGLNWSADARSIVWQIDAVDGDLLAVARLEDAVPDVDLIETPAGFGDAHLEVFNLPIEGWANPISPNGRWVLFTARDIETSDPTLFLADLESSPATIVPIDSDGPADAGELDGWWSPDASGRFVYGEGEVLHVWDAASGAGRIIGPFAPLYWLFDGRLVVRSRGLDALSLVTFTPTSEPSITSLVDGVEDVGLADDGRLLVERRREDGSFALSFYDPEKPAGATVDVLVSEESVGVARAQWSPDGSYVAVAAQYEHQVHVIDLLRTPVSVIATVPGERWTNTNEVLGSPWSRDGAALLVRHEDGLRIHMRDDGFTDAVVVPRSKQHTRYAWQR